MYSILIFAGTTEGRIIAEKLAEQDVMLTVCVATEYGEKPLPKKENIEIIAKRLEQIQMKELIADKKADLVVDATHPYAVEVTKNIVSACEESTVPYMRIKREKSDWNKENCIYVENTKACVSFLESTQGNVLLTTGSKELALFTTLPDYENRLYARVLSTSNVVRDCAELGFEGKHLICMQGPFSEELNYALLKEVDAKYMITKESGSQGGFYEKMVAAERAGVTSVIIGRPSDEEGLNYEDALFTIYQNIMTEIEKEINLIDKDIKFPKRGTEEKTDKRIDLVGIGAGGYQNFTIEADECFRDSDVILGASRMLECVKHYNKPMFPEYTGTKIAEFINDHPKYKKIAVALSGDVGFYSGAKRLLGLKEQFPEFDLKLVPGVSSLVFFASRLKLSWEDAKLISLHGRDINYIKIIKENKKVFSLLGNHVTIRDIAQKLVAHGLENIKIVTGENLSYPDELITEGTAKQFATDESYYHGDSKQLYVAYFENNCLSSPIVTHGIEDGEFIRDEVPMTKMEVRSITLSKLKLKKDSIVYDIGSGTGSVAIECCLQAWKGKVYAIEKNETAVELIQKNKQKFGVYNLEIIHGTAPEQLAELPKPDSVFIGGTSGNLEAIIKVLLEKNPKVNFVVNAITLETLTEAVACIKNNSISQYDIVQVSITRTNKVGKFNMMAGQNPVYIISCRGNG